MSDPFAPGKDHLLSIALDGDEVVIRVGISALAFAAIHAKQLVTFDSEENDFRYPQIIDEARFAQDVVRRLKSEEEDGTTVVHRMLDDAFLVAVENGAEGILMPGDDEYDAIAARNAAEPPHGR